MLDYLRDIRFWALAIAFLVVAAGIWCFRMIEILGDIRRTLSSIDDNLRRLDTTIGCANIGEALSSIRDSTKSIDGSVGFSDIKSKLDYIEKAVIRLIR